MAADYLTVAPLGQLAPQVAALRLLAKGDCVSVLLHGSEHPYG